MQNWYNGFVRSLVNWHKNISTGQRIIAWVAILLGLLVLLTITSGVILFALLPWGYLEIGRRKSKHKVEFEDVDKNGYRNNQQKFDPTLFVDNKLIFENPQDSRIKKIKVGFNVPCFFFTWIALFVKGLIGRGFIVLGVSIFLGIIETYMQAKVHRDDYYQDTSGQAVALFVFFLLVVLGIGIFLGIRANLWHARNLIAQGWILQNADAAKNALASKGWELNLNPVSTSFNASERVIVNCIHCNAALRLPKGKSGMVKCPTCFKSFEAST